MPRQKQQDDLNPGLCVEVGIHQLPAPCTRCALDTRPDNITRHPTTVEIARLRFDPFAIDVAFPIVVRIEAEISLDVSVRRRWILVCPCSVQYISPIRTCDGKVRCKPLPFAKSLLVTGLKMHFDVRGRDIIGWRMKGLEHPEGVAGRGNHIAVGLMTAMPFDDQLLCDPLKSWWPRKGTRIEHCARSVKPRIDGSGLTTDIEELYFR